VLGLAGTMMAAALMSPALAVRLATTSYVKSKINALRVESQNAFIEDGLSYVRSSPVSVGPGLFTVISISCPSGLKVTGGGASVTDATTNDAELEASFPSNGATATAGTTGWTVSVENPSGNAFSAAVYAVCAKSSGSANYTEGGPPAKFNVVTGEL
jgi:hypothetical protein